MGGGVSGRMVGDPVLEAVLFEVAQERARQDAKWGEQNHPDGTARPWPAIFRLSFADCAQIARLQVDHEAKIGTSNYTSILLEEVFEALAETDPAKLREELIQIAAVCVQWVQAIDRRGGAS